MRKADNAIRAVGYETPVANRVTLTLANGKKVIGTNLQEGKEWITLDRARRRHQPLPPRPGDADRPARVRRQGQAGRRMSNVDPASRERERPE